MRHTFLLLFFIHAFIELVSLSSSSFENRNVDYDYINKVVYSFENDPLTLDRANWLAKIVENSSQIPKNVYKRAGQNCYDVETGTPVDISQANSYPNIQCGWGLSFDAFCRTCSYKAELQRKKIKKNDSGIRSRPCKDNSIPLDLYIKSNFDFENNKYFSEQEMRLSSLVRSIGKTRKKRNTPIECQQTFTLLNIKKPISEKYSNYIIHVNMSCPQRNSLPDILTLLGGVLLISATEKLRIIAVKFDKQLPLCLLYLVPCINLIEQDMILTSTLSLIRQKNKNEENWGQDLVSGGFEMADNVRTQVESLPDNNVNVYVLDTGINLLHEDLNENARVIFPGYNLTAQKVYQLMQNKNQSYPKNLYSDCKGHGSHISGVISGKKKGIAPKSSLYMIPVLGCDQNVSVVSVIKALHFLELIIKKPAIINLSLGQPPIELRVTNKATEKTPQTGQKTRQKTSFNLERAPSNRSQGEIEYYFPKLETLGMTLTHFIKDLDVPVVISSGNDGFDICPPLHMDVPDLIVVGAINRYFEYSKFTNHGNCVNFFAPGEDVTSHSNDTSGYTRMSGTSMAAPFISGIAALLMQINGTQMTARQVITRLESILVKVGEKKIKVPQIALLLGITNMTFYEENNPFLTPDNKSTTWFFQFDVSQQTVLIISLIAIFCTLILGFLIVACLICMFLRQRQSRDEQARRERFLMMIAEERDRRNRNSVAV